MATNFRQAVWNAVWDALDGNISATLYDHVPGEALGSPTANKPYAVLENTDTRPWANDTYQGVMAEITIHVFSDALGRSEVDGILDAIYGILDRAALTQTGYVFVDCLYTFSEVMILEDGKTRHGVARYEITLQEA